MQILDHFVFVLDVFLYSFQVLRGPSEVLLLLPVHRLFSLLRRRQNVFDRVGYDEVLVGFQTLDWFFGHSGNWVLLVAAVVGEVADWVGGELPGGRVSLPIVPVCFFRKLSGSGLRSPLR
jgi:hypothetical protein